MRTVDQRQLQAAAVNWCAGRVSCVGPFDERHDVLAAGAASASTARMLPVPASMREYGVRLAEMREQQRARAGTGLRRGASGGERTRAARRPRASRRRTFPPCAGRERSASLRRAETTSRAATLFDPLNGHAIAVTVRELLRPVRGAARVVPDSTRGPIDAILELRRQPRHIDERTTERAQTNPEHLLVQDAERLLLERRQLRRASAPAWSATSRPARCRVRSASRRCTLGRSRRVGAVGAKRTRRITAEELARRRRWTPSIQAPGPRRDGERRSRSGSSAG